MNSTSKFHAAKNDLEIALSDFIECAEKDGRDIIEELNESLFNSCKYIGHKVYKIEED